MNTAIEQLLPASVSHAEFEALTRLLDDADATVVHTIRTKLESYGGSVTPALRALVGTLDNLHAQESVISVVRSLQVKSLELLLECICEASEHNKDVDLEQAIVLLSKFGYPETDAELVKQRLDDIALRVHTLFIKSHNPTDLGLLLSINQAFFEEQGFCAAQGDLYHSPDSTYVHVLLSTATGIPISLATLYMLVAERAGVTLHGIGMPAHFVVYHPELDMYIDAFNNGAFLTEADCKRFITGAGFVFDPTMLERVSNMAILLRMIRNLIFAYTKRNAEWEVAVLQEVSHAIIETMNQ